MTIFFQKITITVYWGLFPSRRKFTICFKFFPLPPPYQIMFLVKIDFFILRTSHSNIIHMSREYITQYIRYIGLEGKQNGHD